MNTQETQKPVTATAVPKLRRFSVKGRGLEGLDTTEAKKAAQELINKTLPELRENIKVAVSWLETAQKQLKEAQQDIAEDRMVEILMAEEIKKQEKEIQKAKNWLSGYLRHDFLPFRWATWVTILTFYFTNHKTRASLESRITILCQSAHVQEDENGPLVIFGKKYSINPDAALGIPEITELQKALKEEEYHIKALEKQAQENEKIALLQEGNLSVKELFQGKAGVFAVETSENGGKSGVLAVQQRRGEKPKIFPYKAVGTFQEEMTELQKTGKYLLLNALKRPEIDTTFLVKTIHFSEREAMLIEKLWLLLRNGIGRENRKENYNRLREKWEALATITPEQFLLEGEHGAAALETEKDWDWYDHEKNQRATISNFFFVAKRQTGEDGPEIAITWYAPWLKDYLQEHLGIFYLEGEKFTSLPESLRMLFRSIWHQVDKRTVKFGKIQEKVDG